MTAILHQLGTRLAWLCLICLLGVGVAVSRLDSRTGVITTRSEATMAFAIADLDGDRKPDVASIEIGRQQANSTAYAIRLQFGGGSDSYIGVDGPLGGLRVAARDVNGDDSVDLVLTSIADARVIEVLLNDGHGNFSSAQAATFLLLGTDADCSLRNCEHGPVDGMALAAMRLAFDAEATDSDESSAKAKSEGFVHSDEPVLKSVALRRRLGRAPPLTRC